MRYLLLLALLFTVMPLAAAEPAKPSTPERPRLTPHEEKNAVKRYQNVPKAAKELVTALQKLDAKIVAGISYDDYDRIVKDLHADVVVFVGSDDAKPVHELSFLLLSASASYTVVRSTWNEVIFGKTADDRNAAKIVLGSVRDRLWKLSSINIDCANELVRGKSKDVVSVINDLRANPELFKPETIIRAVQNAAKERQKKQQEAEFRAFQDRKERKEHDRLAAEAARWRDWTKADGTTIGKARFMSMAMGKVKLKKEGETIITVPIEQLSKEDQKWIRKRSR